MRKQRDINHTMRSILIDWLIEVTEEYKLTLQTFFVTVGYVDRFLSEMAVQRSKLQLVGVTCMLLACKYEEIYPPTIDDFVYITDKTYSRPQVMKMEHVILKVLRFDMGSCTPLTFLYYFLNAIPHHDDTKWLAQYLCELSAYDGRRSLGQRPSTTAAAAIVIALHTFELHPLPPALVSVIRQGPEELQAAVNTLHEIFSVYPNLQHEAIKEKYSTARFNRVAEVPPTRHAPILFT
ncbi:cyclin A [Monosiga brevicollis MX1]|uniref:Cyclin A n=1 Tax=Monosiga brevicollis TaxID=81824 RepID=A9US68_MONBE|nr:cyclin A [Monosiga brevicollis MX1]EDQ92049.1 cyclin A [Monosiga brevicollis MX1]|eukprot:XP_001743335.1 cyclin A [Monosiga brevicollis MX1]